MTPPLLSRLLPLLVAVSLAHWAALSWLREQFPPVRPLAQMAEPLFTRLLQPAPPPATQAPAPSLPHKSFKSNRTTATARELAASPPLAPPAAAAASAPNFDVRTAAAAPESPTPNAASPSDAQPADTSPPEPASPLPQTAATAPDPLDSWPLDTRLSYRLGGYYQGELHGSARVQWQRDKSSYQVRLSVSAAGMTLATLTSQG